MSYWDTSTLVKLYVKEADSDAFEAYSQNLLGVSTTSEIVYHEIRATFRRKESDGLIPPGGSEALYSQFRKDVASGMMALVSFHAIEIEYGHVLNQCYSQQPPVRVRTLDAIHLATAKRARETELVTTDRTMRQAARLLGFTLFPS